MKYSIASDIKQQVDNLIEKLNFTHIKAKNIHCIRSYDAKTRAFARIWGMAKLFKEVVGIEPHYIVEVNGRRFDKLSIRDQTKTLIHELLHIPKTFSGALLSHRGKYHRINDREVERILKDLIEKPRRWPI
jgi:predicted metallopeptidase